MRKFLNRSFLILIGLYLAVAVGLFFNQEKLLFMPDKLPEEYSFRTGTEIELPLHEGPNMNCLWVKRPNSKGVILYLHGTKGNNRRCLRQAEAAFGNANYDIFMPDYRGFGKTEGANCSEKQMLCDVQHAYDFLKKHYSENQIAVAGYFLGTGPATHLA